MKRYAKLLCGHIREIGTVRTQRKYYCFKCKKRQPVVETFYKN